jgi:hypothetical protein
MVYFKKPPGLNASDLYPEGAGFGISVVTESILIFVVILSAQKK